VSVRLHVLHGEERWAPSPLHAWWAEFNAAAASEAYTAPLAAAVGDVSPCQDHKNVCTILRPPS